MTGNATRRIATRDRPAADHASAAANAERPILAHHIAAAIQPHLAHLEAYGIKAADLEALRTAITAAERSCPLGATPSGNEKPPLPNWP